MLPPVYAILDGAVLAARGIRMGEAAGALIEGGIRLLQIRWKQNFDRAVYEELQRTADACRQAGALLVVNDRADVALLLGAGAHVGQEDLRPADVRRVLPAPAILGVSTHNEEQFLQAQSDPVDYVALGPIYGTGSKLNPDPVVGVNELRRLRGESRLPVVAIGGISRDRAPEVWQAGADSVAVIADLYPAECTAASLAARAVEWMNIANEHCN